MRLTNKLCLFLLPLVFLVGSAEAVEQLHDCLVYGDGFSIWVFSLNDGSVAKLCKGQYPQISPDGKWLATGGTDIFLYDLTTMSRKRLTNHNLDHGYIDHLRFSPDSKSIVYVVNRDTFLVKCDGSSDVFLTGSDEYEYIPCFSPQGDLIAYEVAGDIYTIKPDRSDNRIMIKQEKGEIFCSLLFSSDGKKIMYEFCDNERVYGVGEYDLNTSEKKIIKCNDSYPRIGTYSPDGKMILGVCDSTPFYMSRMGGDKSVHFLTDYPNWFNQPFYSVGGNTVEFIRDETAGEKLNILYNLLNAKEGVINGILWDECYFSDVLSSPDGKWLALDLWYADDKHGNILLTTIDQSCQRFLKINTSMYGNEHPSFAPTLISGKLLDTYGNWHTLEQ